MSLDKTRRANIILAAVAFGIVAIAGYLYFSQDSGAVQQAGLEQAATQADTPDTNPYGIPGCRCHSKKPAMVKMHDTIGGQDCGQCHKPGENLMDPNRPPTSPEELKVRQAEEDACQSCHSEGSSSKAAGPEVSTARSTQSAKMQAGMTKISGALFCPKCQKQVKITDKTCSDCSGKIQKTNSGWQCGACGPLVDVDKVAKMSKEKPSNDICKLCHFDSEQLSAKHSSISAYNKSKADVPGGLGNCLGCHKSHNQCGGCHF